MLIVINKEKNGTILYTSSASTTCDCSLGVLKNWFIPQLGHGLILFISLLPFQLSSSNSELHGGDFICAFSNHTLEGTETVTVLEVVGQVGNIASTDL